MAFSKPITPLIRRLTWLLDESITIPKVGKIGIDGLIGLIPGVGDVLTASISAYIIYQASKYDLPKWLILRMLGNVALETLLGLVPILGDAFDFYFKANVHNLKLLSDYIETRTENNAPATPSNYSKSTLLFFTTAALILASLLIWRVIR